jgi:hypothetical protein
MAWFANPYRLQPGCVLRAALSFQEKPNAHFSTRGACLNLHHLDARNCGKEKGGRFRTRLLSFNLHQNSAKYFVAWPEASRSPKEKGEPSGPPSNSSARNFRSWPGLPSDSVAATPGACVST